MTGATVATSLGFAASTAATVGAVGTAAVSAGVGSAISGAVGGGSGGGGSSGSSDSESPMMKQYEYFGPHVSTQPISNAAGYKAENQNVTLPLSDKVTTAKATTAGEVPAAHDRDSTTSSSYSDVWANRLSKYLDYSSRQLG